MTDARLRGEWLNSMKFDNLSDPAWRVFTSALMWSTENGTDGFIPGRYHKRLHPDGINNGAEAELIEAELWVKARGENEVKGYQLLDWDGALGQSTAVQVETYKANGRDRQRKFREKERQRLAKSVGFEDKGATPVTGDVTGYITGGKTRDVGKGKGKGEGAAIQEVSGNETQLVNPQTGEVTESQPLPMSWPTAVPGAGQDQLCGVCHKKLLSPHSKSIGICGKTDAAHKTARAA